MIITRTPFRISFFGGGSDYPTWIKEHGGQVLSTTINKYCYISCRYFGSFFDHSYRISYSKIEHAKNLEEIDHPSVRECIRHLGMPANLEVHHDSDLPARTGLGTSSSFTVGLLNALYSLQGKMISKNYLAKQAIHVEQDLIGETVGCQDQTAAAYGGFNHVEFRRDGQILVNPVIISRDRLEAFQSHLMLFFTGISRTASVVAESKVKNLKAKEEQVKQMSDMIPEVISILGGDGNLDPFGKMLHQSWQLKRSLSAEVTNSVVDDIYEGAMNAGALGGKLLGAGGGGFMLFFVPPEMQNKVQDALKDYLYVPFELDHTGSQVIFYEPHRSAENFQATGGRPSL